MAGKTLVLHIGMPKTGTTSIQETFGRQRGTLLKEGIHYPRKRPFNHANTFTPIFLHSRLNTIHFKQNRINTPEKAETKVDELKRYWEQQFRKNAQDIFIISAESLYRLSAQEIHDVKEFVSPHFDRVRIIVYVRQPEAALKSMWGQRVKTLSETQTQQQLFETLLGAWNFAFVRDWAEAFGRQNIIVRPFDKQAMHNSSLLDDFLVSIGASAGLFPADSIQNEALGRHALALLYESNLRYPLFVNRAPNPDKGLSDKMGIFLKMLQRLEDEKFNVSVRLNIEQAETINTNIEIINDFLEPNQRFALVTPSQEPMSFPRFEDIPKEYLLDLINEYNKYIDQLLEVNLHAQVELMNPKAGRVARKLSRAIRSVLSRFGILHR
jgi:hypothetical protein